MFLRAQIPRDLPLGLHSSLRLLGQRLRRQRMRHGRLSQPSWRSRRQEGGQGTADGGRDGVAELFTNIYQFSLHLILWLFWDAALIKSIGTGYCSSPSLMILIPQVFLLIIIKEWKGDGGNDGRRNQRNSRSSNVEHARNHRTRRKRHSGWLLLLLLLFRGWRVNFFAVCVRKVLFLFLSVYFI